MTKQMTIRSHATTSRPSVTLARPAASRTPEAPPPPPETGVHRDPPLFPPGLHVGLIHDCIDRVGAMTAFGEDDVEDRLDRIPMVHRGNLGDRLALHVAQRILKRAGDQNAGAAAR